MTAEALLTLAVLQLLLAMSPGPATVLTLRTAAVHGARASVALSAGLAFGVVVWAAAALAGLALVFEAAPIVQTVFRVAGVAFLLWIAFGLWRDADAPLSSDNSARTEVSTIRLVRLGIITDLANPKALAYFAAVFVNLVPESPEFGLAAFILALIFAIEFAWYTMLSFVFSRQGPAFLYGRVKFWVDRLFAALLGAFAIRIALPTETTS